MFVTVFCTQINTAKYALQHDSSGMQLVKIKWRVIESTLNKFNNCIKDDTFLYTLQASILINNKKIDASLHHRMLYLYYSSGDNMTFTNIVPLQLTVYLHITHKYLLIKVKSKSEGGGSCLNSPPTPPNLPPVCATLRWHQNHGSDISINTVYVPMQDSYSSCSQSLDQTSLVKPYYHHKDLLTI